MRRSADAMARPIPGAVQLPSYSPAPDAGRSARPPADDEVTLTALLRIVWRRWTVALPLFLVCAGGAGALYLRQVPQYEASAIIRVDKTKEVVPGLSSVASSGWTSPYELATEIQVIQSRAVAREAAARGGYALQVVTPQMPRSTLLEAITIGSNAAPGRYTLRGAGDGRLVLTGPGGGEATGAAGAWLAVGGLQVKPTPAVLEQPEGVTMALLSEEAAGDVLRGAVRVTQPVREAELLRITVRDTDPLLAARMADAVAETFIESQTRRRQVGGRSMVGFIRAQLDTLEPQLAAAEERLRDWRSTQKVVVPGAEAGSAVARRGEYEQRLTERRLELENIEGLLGGALPPGDAGQSELLRRGFRTVLSSPVMRGNAGGNAILTTLIELEAKRADLKLRRTDEDPEVQVLDRTIADYERQGRLFVASYVNALRTEIAGTERALGRVGTQLERFPGQELELTTLQRNAEVLAELQGTLRTRLKEAEITNASSEPTSELLDRAVPPDGPVSPVLVRFLALGLATGVFFGTLGAVVRDRMDRTIHSREDLERATGGALLALVPSFGGAKALGKRTGGSPGARGRPREPGTAVTVEGKAVVALAHPERVLAVHAPRHVASEAYRMLRTNLRFTPADQPRQVLIVTSPTPGDGKSTTALNYAATVAVQGKRVLLVDGDMRRGTQHTQLGLPRGPGLSDVLSGQVPGDAAVRTVQLADGVLMDVISAGDAPPNPAELLGSPVLAALVRWARANYDTVVLDTPPVNLFADGLLLATAGDAVLLVGRAGKSFREELAMAASQVRAVQVPLAGVVLNDYNVKRDSRYGSAYYQYDRSYYKYYAEYAKDDAA
jgi:tyrosine-protein kinase Etk/Wzc